MTRWQESSGARSRLPACHRRVPARSPTPTARRCGYDEPMPRLLPATALVITLGALALAEDTLRDPPAVSVTRIRGATVTGDGVASLDAENVVLLRGEERVQIPLADTIEIAFATAPDAAREFRDDEVAADLWSGEVVHGRIAGGDADGVTLETPLAGTVTVSLDHLAGLRFRKRLGQVVEPPDLTTTRGGEHPDTLHMVGGDRIHCTIDSLGAEAVACSTAAGPKASIPYAKLTALVLGQLGDAPRPPKGIALDIVLRDGMRLTGTQPAVERGSLRLRSVSGFTAVAALRDTVAVHVRSDAFRYLSDVPAPEIEVKPFWKPVAGDATKLYAPRMDRNWGGGALRCGGRTWLRGIGVFSGTKLTWKLDGTTYREFRATAGMDDAAGQLGGAVFEVRVDGKRRWASGFLRPAGTEGRGKAGPQDVGRISLEGAKTLTLEVIAGDREDPYPIQDHADWLGAMLVK